MRVTMHKRAMRTDELKQLDVSFENIGSQKVAIDMNREVILRSELAKQESA